MLEKAQIALQGKADMASGSFMMRRALYESLHAKEKGDAEPVQDAELVETDDVNIHVEGKQMVDEQTGFPGKQLLKSSAVVMCQTRSKLR